MKLHLPKRLLTALLAAFTAISLSTGSTAWGAWSGNSYYVTGNDEISTADGSFDSTAASKLFLRVDKPAGTPSTQAATISSLTLATKETAYTFEINGHWSDGNKKFTNLIISSLSSNTDNATLNIETGNVVSINSLSGTLNNLTNAGSLTLGTAAIQDGAFTINTLTNSGALHVADNTTVTITGTLRNTGTLTGGIGAALISNVTADSTFTYGGLNIATNQAATWDYLTNSMIYSQNATVGINSTGGSVQFAKDSSTLENITITLNSLSATGGTTSISGAEGVSVTGNLQNLELNNSQTLQIGQNVNLTYSKTENNAFGIAIGNGTLVVDGGTLSTESLIMKHFNWNRASRLDILNGGLVEVTGDVAANHKAGSVRLAHWPIGSGGKAIVNVTNGEFRVLNTSINMGDDGAADVTVGTQGILNAKGIRMKEGAELTVQGILNLGSDGITNSQAASVIEITGGHLGALSSDLNGSTQAFNFSNNATIHTSIYDVENRQYTDTAANIVLGGNTEISDTTVTGSGTLTLSGTTTASGTINLEGSSNLSISNLLANSTISFTGATASNLTIGSVSVNPANHQLLLKEGSESAIKYGTHVDSATANGNGFMYFATYVLFDGFAWTGDNANVDQFIVSTDDTHTYLTVDTPASIFYVNNGNHCFSSESAETSNKITKYVVANGATLTLDAGSVNGRNAATALTMVTGTGTIKYDAGGTVIINNAGMATDFTGTFDLTSGTVYVGNKQASGSSLDNSGGDTTFKASKVIVRAGATFLTHLGGGESGDGKDFAPSFDLMNGATFGNRDGHVDYTGNFRFNIVDPSAANPTYDKNGVVTLKQYWEKTLNFTGKLEGGGTVLFKSGEQESAYTYKLSNSGNTFDGIYRIIDGDAQDNSNRTTTIQLAASNAAQFATVSLDTISGKSVLLLNQNSTIAGLNSAVGANSANKVTASANATLTVNGGGSYAGLLQNGSGVLSLTKTGAGTLTLSGNVGAENAALGTITVTNGHLALNGTSWVSNVTLNGGSGQTGHLTYGGGVTHTIAGTLQSSNHNRTAGSVTVEAGTTLNVGYLNNSWGMNMVVNGQVSTFAIDGNAASDKVRLASASAASITGEGNLTTNNLIVENSTSDYTINLNQLNIRNSLTINDSSQLHLGSNTTTIGGAVTLNNANNTLSFEKGTATVSGAVTNKGTINVLDGSVYLNGGISGSGKVVLSGGALSFASGVTNEISQFNYSGGTLSHSGLTVTNAEFSGITLDNSANTNGALNITGNLNVISAGALTQVENITPTYSYTAKEGETVNTGNGFASGSFYVINGGTITGDYTVQLNGTNLSFAELGQGTGNYASKAENSIIITLNGDTTGTFYAMTPAGTDDSGNLIPSVAINRNTAGSYFVASGAVLKFIDSLAEAEVWEKQISGEGTVQLSITNADRHDAGLKFGSGFNGVVEIAGGKMRFENFNLGHEATVKLYTGEVWNKNATTFANKLIMAGASEDAFLVKGGTLTLTGAVTGTNLKTETGLILTNAANDLDMLKVVGGTTQISAGSYGQVKVTSGTVNASGGNIGHLNASGGTITLSGTATVDGTGDTGNYRVAGIYAEGGTINIGNEVDDYTLVAPRVETGNGGASKLNIKQNATLVVTGSDFEGETGATENGYWKTGFILGEWEGSSVLTVKGTLLVQNAHIEHGNATGTINIENGGVVATRGIRGGINMGEPNASGRIELNLKDGGKLILGEGGIDAQNLTSSLAAGTIGISADNVTIADNLTLSSAIGTTFDTQKHVWTGEGTTLAVNRGDTGGNLLISGAISGDGKLIKAGSGTLTLSADNTYTGGTAINAGTVEASHTNALGNGSVVIGANGILSLLSNLTIQGTLSSSGSIILADDATFTLGGGSLNEPIVHSIKTITGGTGSKLNLAENAVLNTITSVTSSITVTGSGTYHMASAGQSNLTGWTDSANWTGTVVLNGMDLKGDASGRKLADFGNSASTVRLTNVTGWFYPTYNQDGNSFDNSAEYAFNLELVNGSAGYAFKVTNGSSNYTTIFSGKVSGSGDLNYNLSGGSDSHIYKFTNDISEWKPDGDESPEIIVSATKTLSIILADNANTANVAFNKGTASGVLNLTVETTEAATFNNTVNVNSLTLNQSATFNNVLQAASASVAANKVLTLGGGTDAEPAAHSIGTLSAASAGVTLGNHTTLSLGGGTADAQVTHSIGTLSAASADVALGNYATLSLGGGTAEVPVTHSIGTMTGGTGSKLNLAENAVLNAISSANGITLTGRGTYMLASGASTITTGVTLDSTDWSGTIAISNVSGNNNLTNILNDLGNNTPTVSATNVQGYFNTPSSSGGMEVQPNLHLVNGRDGETELAAIKITNGNSDATLGTRWAEFSGAISGSGDITFKSWIGQNKTATYKFTGNVSKWDGDFIILSGGSQGNANIVFSGDATEINANFQNKNRATNNLYLEIGKADETGKKYELNGTLDVDKLTLKQSAVFSNTVDVSGEVSVANDKNITITSTLTADSVQLGDTATITKAAGKEAASMQNVKLSEEGIASADETKATKGSVTDAKVTLAALAEGTSFSIEDVTLKNVNIAAANAETKVNLSGVSATDVQLTKGEFHMLDKAQPQVGTGGSAINRPTDLQFSTSLLNGMTLGADASMVVDLGDLSGFTGMDSGKPTFSITLNGFSIEGFKIGDFLSDNPGIYFAADSWLGQLLVAQGASDYVKSDSLEAGAQATAGSGSGVGVSYTSTAVGTVIIISGLQVPEPTTSTLGLIALSALAMRRRRK